jgi:hydrogenase large subunit
MPVSPASVADKGQTLVIDPISRIEGHLKVETVVEGGRVKDARASGTLWRGFEQVLVGRHPVDAVRITQRVCGVCPVVHATASSFCLDEALGVADRIPENGRLVRNLVLASNYLQSHILHFFALAALDYVDVAAAADYAGDDGDLKAVQAFISRGALAPFIPRYEGDYRCSKDENVGLLRAYLQALHVRRTCHEMLSVFGGKMPHNVDMVPGGVTCEVTADKVATFAGKLTDVQAFIEDAYLPAVVAVARRYPDYLDIGAGCRRFLSYGVFNEDHASTDPLTRRRLLPAGLVEAGGQVAPVDAAKITEEVRHSRYSEGCAGPPAEGATVPAPEKAGGYSWLKAPRYAGAPAEVGPLARTLVAYAAGAEPVRTEVNGALSALGASASQLPSVLGRHLARALEARQIADAMTCWLGELKPGEPVAVPYAIPNESAGAGLVDGPRGALGHWIQVKDRRIDRYQLVVPTTWNGSPRDAAGTPGPIEQALIGAPVRDLKNPFEIVRIIRSFDPCLACAVHLVTARGESLGVCRILS